MSVLIKDMAMPKSCMNCMFCGFAGADCELDLCQITGNAQKHIPYSKMPDCPLIEIPCDYDELLRAARAMHTWIFLHSGNEELAYKACGLSDEMNAFLGYSGSLTLTI